MAEGREGLWASMVRGIASAVCAFWPIAILHVWCLWWPRLCGGGGRVEVRAGGACSKLRCHQGSSS